MSECEPTQAPGASDRSRPCVAFVAGGGAIKAYAFHAGVLRAMAQDGFSFRAGLRWQPTLVGAGARQIDTFVGSSAGACIVAGITSGNELDELRLAILGESRKVPTFGYRVMFSPVAPNPLRYVRRLGRRIRLGQLRANHLIDFGGVVSAAGIERYFRRHVLPTNRFADLAARLFLVATQVNGSRKVIFGPTDSLADEGYDSGCAYYDNVPVSEALAAAVSLPPLFAPYGIVNPATGKLFHYYDGEVREPLSVHVARDAGADFAIASSIWQPLAYHRDVGSLGDFGMVTVAEQALHQAFEQRILNERARAAELDQLLELVAEHGRRASWAEPEVTALQQQMCAHLRHRRTKTLLVTPDPGDAGFFFQGSFRFERKLIERCVEAGARAYARAVNESPEFLPALDQALGAAPG